MNIKEVSEQLDVSRGTLRYWESSGLLPKIPRNHSGYREYTEKEIKWVLFIKAMRRAGLSVETLAEFVHQYRAPVVNRTRQKALVKDQYVALIQQRKELDKTINYLAYKINHFDSHVLPFLEEEDYYQLRKKAMVKHGGQNGR